MTITAAKSGRRWRLEGAGCGGALAQWRCVSASAASATLPVVVANGANEKLLFAGQQHPF